MNTSNDNIKVSSLSKKVIYHKKKTQVSCNVPIDKDDNCDCLKGTELVINMIFSMKCF